MGIDKALAIGNKCSLGNLITHLMSHPKENQEYAKITAKVSLQEASEQPKREKCSRDNKLSITKQCEKSCLNPFTKWTVVEFQPFNVRESSSFKAMIQAANPRISPPGTKLLKRKLNVMKVNVTEKIKTFLVGKYFSVTIEHWTSVANENYAALTEEQGDEEDVVIAAKKARDLVPHVNSSPLANAKLASAQKKVSPDKQVLVLIQDVKTRWWARYQMLERILSLKLAIKFRFAEEFHNREHQDKKTLLEQFELSANDFLVINDVVHVLMPFKVAQEALEGQNYVNLSHSTFERLTIVYKTRSIRWIAIVLTPVFQAQQAYEDSSISRLITHSNA